MNLLEEMKKKPKVIDGSLYTMIYEKGIFINTCYEELCISNPDLILRTHQEYVQAGADIIKSNTFGANRIKLESYGLVDQLEKINRAAIQIAKRSITNGQYVVGSIGPCLKPKQYLNKSNKDKVKNIFEEQMKILSEEGINAFFLETFTHSKEILIAAEVAKSFEIPVIASVNVGKDGETESGEVIEAVIDILERSNSIDGIGINAGLGPAAAFSITERVISLTSKPFTVMADAGLPQEVNGRFIYMSNPEYFSEYSKKLIELGVSAIGGGCGTNAEHIQTMSKQIKSLSRVKEHIKITDYYPRKSEGINIIKIADKSNVAAKLSRGEKVTTVEITPPRSVELDPMLEKCKQCKDAGVDAINIPDGPRASARISPLVSALAIEKQVGIETVLHYCCRDRNLIGMQSDLLGGYAGGLRNYLIITGDPPKLGDYPDSTAVFDVDAVGLTQVVHNLNHGLDVGGNRINPPTGILIGVGANPCAVNLNQELDHYMNKIQAGAEYAITQPIFDVDALLRFLDKVEEKCDSIPVIAGVWPLVSYRNAEFLKNEVPGVEIPEKILQKMSKAKTKEDGRKIGTEIAREIRDSINDRVAGFQVSAPFGIVDLALKVIE